MKRDLQAIFLIWVMLVANLHAVMPFVLAKASTAGPQTASDNFNSYSDGSTLAGQGNWVSLGGTMALKVVNPSGDGRAVGASGDVLNINYYNAGTWADNQWTASTSFSNTGQDIVVAVRCNPGSGGSCYFAIWTPGFGGFLQWGVLTNGSNSTSNIGAQAGNAGDVLRLEVTGSGSSTRLTVKFNGVTKLSSQDPGGTYISSGKPGVGNGAGAGTSTTTGVTFWQASDI